MKNAAGIVGLLIGIMSLGYIGIYGGLTGVAAGWLGSWGPSGNSLSNWAETVKVLSWLAPILALAGGALCFNVPRLGGLLLASSAFCHYQLLGFGSVANLFVLPTAIAAILAFIDGYSQPSLATSSGTPISASQTPSSLTSELDQTFDRQRWNALLSYDDEIAAAADQIHPLGAHWVDELASSYLALNDKSYLPGIVQKITAKAKAKEEELIRLREEAIQRQHELEMERQRAAQARREKLLEYRNWVWEVSWSTKRRRMITWLVLGVAVLGTAILELRPRPPQMHIVGRDGDIFTVPSVVAGRTPDYTLSNGSYYNLTSAPSGTESRDFALTYGTDSSITVSLLKKPLGVTRLHAERRIKELFPLPDRSLCDLNFIVGAPFSVSHMFSGRLLGLSFCPNAVKLPMTSPSP